MKKIRKPAVAGYFYPSNEKELSSKIFSLFQKADINTEIENITGLISPHAGYIYSGLTASYAFKLIEKNDYTTVIVISPSHHEYFKGISIYNGDAYQTPLGTIPLNIEMKEKIIDSSDAIISSELGHKNEHGIEVILPFLQYILPQFSLLPVVMGDQNKIYIDKLAESIASVADEKTLIVASSDLSHFYNKKIADKLDSRTAKHINEFNFDELYNDLHNGNCEACGGGPIIAMMKASSILQKKKSLVLHRSDSGDISGDNNEVVGYLSAVIYGE